MLTVVNEDPEFTYSQMEFEEIAMAAVSLYSINLLPGSARNVNEDGAKAQYPDIRYGILTFPTIAYLLRCRSLTANCG
jgi:hypothetical protein